MEQRETIPPYVPKITTAEAMYAREVKRQLAKVVLAVVAYFLIQLIVSGIIETVLMLSSGLMDNMMQGAMDMAQSGEGLDYNSLMESSQASTQAILSEYIGLITIISAVAGLPIFLLLRGQRLFTTDITAKQAPLSLPSFLQLWVIAMGAQLVFNVGAGLINEALAQSGQSATEMMEQAMQMLNTPVGLLYICIIGPIIEEIIFRGAIMKSLERFGINFSIIISALVFGLFHIFTVQAVFAFFMGIILGYIASRYSLKWSILAHILINSVATGVDYIRSIGGYDPISETTQGTSFSILAGAILLALFIGGIVFLIKERWRFAEQKSVGAPIRIPGSPERTGTALWRATFTSIPLLLYIAATVSAGIAMIIFPAFNL
jgi:membrane protease YdiL (CAAX protease family)